MGQSPSTEGTLTDREVLQKISDTLFPEPEPRVSETGFHYRVTDSVFWEMESVCTELQQRHNDELTARTVQRIQAKIIEVELLLKNAGIKVHD